MTRNRQCSTTSRLLPRAILCGCLCSLLACAAGSETGPAGSGGGSGAATTDGGGSGSGGAVTAAGGGGTSGAVGTNVDNGSLFKDAGAVGTILADASGPQAMPDASTGANQDGTGSGIPGDGNTATGKIGGFGLTAVFTQKGVDVTVVITATNCPAGAHTFTIHEGFACDDPTKGPVWGGGKRGGGIPSLMCDATKHGSLTYTRTGSDPSTNWTVADHNGTTDLTLHPLMADSQCGTFF